jgi:hypothetical protein
MGALPPEVLEGKRRARHAPERRNSAATKFQGFRGVPSASKWRIRVRGQRHCWKSHMRYGVAKS